MLAALAGAAVPARAQRITPPASAGARGGSTFLRDTTVVLPSGGAVRISAYPMGASGIEVCAAVARGVRPGKSLQVRADGWAEGIAPMVRFPTTPLAPSCTMLRDAAGDSITLTFVHQVRDPIGRVYRQTVGFHRLPVSLLWRRRVTVRWVREGGERTTVDTIPGR